MTHTSPAAGGFEPADLAQLATINRAALVECTHFGLACLVSPTGQLLAEYGKASKLVYPRSAVKPLQTVATQRAGLHLQGAQLAISSGSHQGTAEHVALVREILSDAQLSFDDLRCPVAWPGNSQARSQANSPSKECFNCSGKHAAFLAACVAAGWDTETYLEPGHPLQILIRQVLEEYSGENITVSTIDGCGAPLHAMSLAGLAKSIGKFAKQDSQAATAMLDFPWAVGGYDSPDYFVLAQGMVAKLGAEGVFVIGLADGHGVAVKIADGSLRAAPAVALKVLLNHGLIEQQVYLELCEQINPKILGGASVVGQLTVVI
jgi:L-asparaginase II